jgi:archaellum component FlaC
MDERIKNIRGLEGEKAGEENILRDHLEKLGRALLAREAEPLTAEQGEYRRLLEESADAEAQIRLLEADMLHFKELEAGITEKEKEQSGELKEMAALYTQLGDHLLNNPRFDDPAGVYRQQLDALLPKIRSMENRLEELEARDDDGVFSRLGKSAQGMVVRSFLGKNQENLNRVYRKAGEDFFNSRQEDLPPDGEIDTLTAQIEERRKRFSALGDDISQLKGDHRKIGASFGAEGNPARKIQSLERLTARLGEDIHSLCRKYGNAAADPEKKKRFEPLLEEEEKSQIEKIREHRISIAGIDREIARLQASLAIDEEKTEIEKMNRSIEAQRRKIAGAEEIIGEMEKRIAGSQARIEELNKLL